MRYCPDSAPTNEDVGIAIGAGTDVAVESAGIVLVRSDPRDVVRAIELSRAAYRKMVQNLTRLRLRPTRCISTAREYRA
jgi:hypothetical protein